MSNEDQTVDFIYINNDALFMKKLPPMFPSIPGITKLLELAAEEGDTVCLIDAPADTESPEELVAGFNAAVEENKLDADALDICAGAAMLVDVAQAVEADAAGAITRIIDDCTPLHALPVPPITSLPGLRTPALAALFLAGDEVVKYLAANAIFAKGAAAEVPAKTEAEDKAEAETESEGDAEAPAPSCGYRDVLVVLRATPVDEVKAPALLFKDGATEEEILDILSGFEFADDDFEPVLVAAASLAYVLKYDEDYVIVALVGNKAISELALTVFEEEVEGDDEE